MIFYVEFTKKLVLFSLFTPWFFIRNKHHKRRRTFFERGGGNSLKRTYVEGVGGGGGTCKINRNGQEGRGVKNWKFWANVLFEWPIWWKLAQSGLEFLMLGRYLIHAFNFNGNNISLWWAFQRGLHWGC